MPQKTNDLFFLQVKLSDFVVFSISDDRPLGIDIGIYRHLYIYISGEC